MQMREKMHYESGEAERRRVREGGEGLPGWVCCCQTKKKLKKRKEKKIRS